MEPLFLGTNDSTTVKSCNLFLRHTKESGKIEFRKWVKYVWHSKKYNYKKLSSMT